MKIVPLKLASVSVAVVRGLKSSSIEKCFSIPSTLMATSVEVCKVIQVYYEINIKACTEGFHRNVEMNIPIFIGKIMSILLPSAPTMNIPAVHQPLAPSAPDDFNHTLNTNEPQQDLRKKGF